MLRFCGELTFHGQSDGDSKLKILPLNFMRFPLFEFMARVNLSPVLCGATLAHPEQQTLRLRVPSDAE